MSADLLQSSQTAGPSVQMVPARVGCDALAGEAGDFVVAGSCTGLQYRPMGSDEGATSPTHTQVFGGGLSWRSESEVGKADRITTSFVSLPRGCNIAVGDQSKVIDVDAAPSKMSADASAERGRHGRACSPGVAVTDSGVQRCVS